MTLRSNSYRPFDRLRERYLLEPGPMGAFPPSVFGAIIPITNADALVTDTGMETTTNDLSGLGSTVAHSVPTGKRWFIDWLYLSAATGITQFGIRLVDGSDILYLEVGATGQRTFATNGIQLEEGWEIVLADTNNGADTARKSRVLYREVDVHGVER